MGTLRARILTILAAASLSGCIGAADDGMESPVGAERQQAPIQEHRTRDGRLRSPSYDLALGEPGPSSHVTRSPSALTEDVGNGDTCASAKTMHLTGPGTSAYDSASTVGYTDDYYSFCGDTSAAADTPDLVYALTLDTAGVLTLQATGTSGFQPAIAVNTTCGVLANDSRCVDTAGWGGVLKGWFTAGTYYVTIDGAQGTSGGFTFSATLAANTCGDGVVAGSEACDDGNTVNDDGCSAACGNQLPLATADACGGTAVSITTTQTISSYTTGYTDDYSGSCGGAGGADRVWHVVPTASGTLTVKVGYVTGTSTPVCAGNIWAASCWDWILYARSGACSGTTAAEIACSDAWDFDTPESLSFAVTANQDYWIFLDGYDSANYGPFDLQMALQ